MPLKRALQDVDISESDADLLESIFNMTVPLGNETDAARRKRAEKLVRIFVAGEHDRDTLIQALTGPGSKRV